MLLAAMKCSMQWTGCVLGLEHIRIQAAALDSKKIRDSATTTSFKNWVGFWRQLLQRFGVDSNFVPQRFDLALALRKFRRQLCSDLTTGLNNVVAPVQTQEIVGLKEKIADHSREFRNTKMMFRTFTWLLVTCYLSKYVLNEMFKSSPDAKGFMKACSSEAVFTVFACVGVKWIKITAATFNFIYPAR